MLHSKRALKEFDVRGSSVQDSTNVPRVSAQGEGTSIVGHTLPIPEAKVKELEVGLALAAEVEVEARAVDLAKQLEQAMQELKNIG
ncbi:hypothetical protein GW17_00008930 [Ensete ventricosum]|nr:hypothetical protein GW17_00008930 [Ensete ventricosum]RZR93345.1 hypothetical protein BHM03_00021832 [Ensete ventricosum]